SVTGRIAMKRFSPASQQWTGGSVLPAETSVLSVRMTTEPTGNALLLFVAMEPGRGSEGALRAIREGVGGAWTDVCPSLTPPPSNVRTFANTSLGFGIARSSTTGEPVAAFTNGESIFVRACRGGGWVGLDGGTGDVGAVVVYGALTA